MSVLKQMWPEEGLVLESLLLFTLPQPILCALVKFIPCGPSYVQKRYFNVKWV